VDLILLGFENALAPDKVFFCFVGVTVGTFVGVLPGIGPVAAVSMLLPLSFHMEATNALIMLAGIFYGAMYGGSTASILLNLPGSPSAAVSALEGYPMSKQGRAGVALFITTITSFVGGTLAILLVMAFAPLLAEVAMAFTSVEYFTIMLLALVAASTLSVGSPLKGMAMVIAGLAFGTVGTDITSGQYRFTFGTIELTDGLSLVAVAMGLFGVAEILQNAGQKQPIVIKAKDITLRSMIPRRDDVRRSIWPTFRGWALGSSIGILPGTGPAIAAFMAYALERRVANDPNRFGKGAIEGLAAPESANNAAIQAAFIPTLSLGIPGDALMAVMLAAMMIHGIIPGPQFITHEATLFWSLIASFWIGNLLLLILNIPLIGLWVRILAIPYRILYPAMLFFICIGVFSIRNSLFDIFVVMFFGLVGYLLTMFRYPVAPMLLGFILSPLLEEHFRRALLVSRGDFFVFVQRPISAAFLVLTLFVILLSIRGVVAARQKEMVIE
jgi:putative tricarboxylic transport membrane protein